MRMQAARDDQVLDLVSFDVRGKRQVSCKKPRDGRLAGARDARDKNSNRNELRRRGGLGACDARTQGASIPVGIDATEDAAACVHSTSRRHKGSFRFEF